MSTFKFPDELLGQHIVIVGKTGSGKTYTGKGMVERLLAHSRRVCILDPTGVWWGLRSTASGKGAGFPVVVFGGAHADVPIAEGSGAALAKIVAEKNLPSIIDLSEMLIGGRHRFVTDFAEALYRFNRQPLELVIDEADEFAPQNPMPETKRMLHQVDRIVRRGRVRGLRVMLLTQRPAVLHKNVMTQANTLIAMRLTAPQDRNAIKAWIDGQADAAQGKAVLDSLPQLKRGEGWVWAPELEILERATFPKIDTFDSSRTPENDETVLEPTKLAAVDLSEVKASFAAVQQEANSLVDLKKENVALRREVAETNLKLMALQKAKPTAGVPEAEVQRRVREAVAAVPKTAPAVNPKLTKALEQICRLATSALGLTALPPIETTVVETRLNRSLRVTNARTAETKALVRVTAGISRPQQQILDSLAALGTFGVAQPEKETLAAHAGVPSTSGGFRNNLSVLKTAGLIDYPSPGLAALTEAGAGRANVPDQPPTLADLHEAWLRLVSGPQQAILRALLNAYPRSIDKSALADHVGVPATSGGYRNNLSRLKTMRAIDYPSPGAARAADILFPERS